jgi:hypothetical protein
MTVKTAIYIALALLPGAGISTQIPETAAESFRRQGVYERRQGVMEMPELWLCL